MTKACTFTPKLDYLRVFTTQAPTVEGQNERPTRAPLDAKGSIGCAAADEAIEPLSLKLADFLSKDFKSAIFNFNLISYLYYERLTSKVDKTFTRLSELDKSRFNKISLDYLSHSTARARHCTSKFSTSLARSTW